MKLRNILSLILAVLMLSAGVLSAGCSTDAQITDSADVETRQDGHSDGPPETEEGKSFPSAPEGTIFGARKITQDEHLTLIEGKKYVSPSSLELELYYDYAKLPVLMDGKTYFLTVDENRNEGESWGKGVFSSNIEGATFAFLESDTERGLDSIMRDGKTLRLYVFGDGVYTAPELIFTTLPVMTINTEKNREIPWEDIKCDFTVFTPRSKGSIAYTDASAATIRIRGASSTAMPKKAYRLTLYKEDYSDTNGISLLGMRRDDDWILYASYSDESKIRDATGWALWGKMGAYIMGDAQGTINLRYTEVIINGMYSGFYVFMERFDQKTLDLDEDDVLFVGKTWDTPSADVMKGLTPETTYYGGIERKYPDEDEIGEGKSRGWDVLAEYVRAIYETDGSDFARAIEKTANIQNHLDYWLFLQIIMGEDNLWKNTYYAIIDGKIYCFPWDLDVTFGLGWDGGVKNFLYRNKKAATNLYDHRCGRRIVKYYPGAANYVKKRWQELLDQNIATVDGIMEMAEGYWNDLWRSGAFMRNLNRWPDTSYVEDLDYFRESMQRRIEFLDDYIKSLKDAGE